MWYNSGKADVSSFGREQQEGVMHSIQPTKGFTIVELLIVVIVIGILAVITVVAYNGISQQSRVSGLKYTLHQMSKQMQVFYTQNNERYPTTLAAANITLPTEGVWIYNGGGSSGFCISGTVDGNPYRVRNGLSSPEGGSCSGWMAAGSCPTGYIVVPGNVSIGTSDFCLMKYEAKNVAGVATAAAAGQPWVDISQDSAASASAAACVGCHLVTEAEWMTVAANVLSVASNWSTGVVGSGYLYQGHVNNNPTTALEATSDDTDGLYGITGGTGSASGVNSRRTLTLTNGEVIWDLSGNVWEWTSQAQVMSNVGVTTDSSFSWWQFNNGSFSLGNLPAVSRNSVLASTPGLSGIASWNSSRGIGQAYVNYADTALRGFARGGRMNNTTYAGVLSINLGQLPSNISSFNGFRVAR